MKFARFSVIAGFVAASLLLATAPSHSQAGYVALPSDLGVLTTSGNFTSVGDKTFTFLSYSNTRSPVGGGNPIAAGSVAVGALSGDPTSPVPPFGFELTAPLAADANTRNANDIAFSYTVTSSGAGITAVNLFTNGATTGSGFAEVSESVFVNNGGVKGAYLGQLAVVGAGTDTLDLRGAYSSLFVVKDIQFDVLGATGTAAISVVDQTFTQGAVPEPASIAMMGMGLVGVLGAVRMRRKATA